MGYAIKIQKVERAANTTSFYVNLPLVLAKTMDVKKGETFEWLVEDKNTFILKRIKISNQTKKRKK